MSIVRATEARSFGGLLRRVVLAETNQTGGALGATFVEQGPGNFAGPGLHRHQTTDEAWYVLSGSMVFQLEDEIQEATPGDFVFVPRGTAHAFKVGTNGGSWLVLFMPGEFQKYFDELEEARTHGQLTPDVLAQLQKSYGMEPLGPATDLERFARELDEGHR